MRFIDDLKKRAKKLKSEAQVLMIAYADKRTPFAAKLLIWVTLGYLLSPIDLIPDFIPILGMLDDIIIVPLLIKASISLIPAIVIAETRQRLLNEPANLKKSNWLFAGFILLIWLGAIYFAYVLGGRIWDSDIR